MQTVNNDVFRGVASPAYVFSEQEFIDRATLVKTSFGEDTDICFSIKANPFLLAVLPDVFSKIEVCSPGELEICKALKIDPSRIIFSGVNKSREETERAIDYGAALVTAESYRHLDHISSVASERGITVDVLVRLSCESQFGMDKSDVFKVIADRVSYPGINIVGIHYFTGTQKTRPKEIIKEISRLNKILDRLEEELGFVPERIEYGTGLAVDYFSAEADESEAARLNDISECIRELSKRVHVTVEMGRFFAAPCGHYVTTVVDTKTNDGLNYAILDGGLHQLKYDGQIQGMQVPMITHLKGADNERAADEDEKWTLCGSLCTTADVIARNASLPGLSIGDRLVLHRTGAYSIYEGFSMFLSRDLPSIYVLDKDGGLHLMRKRIETAQFNMPEDLAEWL
ncbi:MAG: diaminopimelate decarboxylase [Clostridiales bacterium]|nr:diaminopimelate decarboxylase [Clostridiales bacterium]